MKIPDWAVLEFKKLFEENNRVWKLARPKAKPIYKKLGWKPTPQDIYDAIHDITEIDRSTACGKEKRFDGFWGGYRFCGRTCECSRIQATEKSKITNMERYGVESAMARPDVQAKARVTMKTRYGVEFSGQSADLQKKMRKTNVERYGVDNPLKNTDVQEKVRQTHIARYGADNAAKVEEFQVKKRKTNVERYGVTCPLENEAVKQKSRDTIKHRYGVEYATQSQDVKDRTRKTNMARYGVEYLQQSEGFRQKSKETCLDRYGVDNPSKCSVILNKHRVANMQRFGYEYAIQSQEKKDKSRLTNLERYGVPVSSQSPQAKLAAQKTNQDRYGANHTAQRNISKNSLSILYSKEKFTSMVVTKSINTIALELGIHATTAYQYCKIYDIPKQKSSYEVELKVFLDSLEVGIVDTNNRSVLKNLELDLYLPHRAIAIEFNGIYYHSSIFKDAQYHRRKYEACRDLGIRLLMINEDEWKQRPNTIKSRIQNLLGRSERGVAARKLSIGKIDAASANSFIDLYHIQGKTGTISYANGAFDGDELVGVMAFNYQRGTGHTELIRFCSSGKSHAGMFSRMLKHATAENNYTEIISFADLRYSVGDVYEKNGFNLVKEIPADYRYVFKNRTWHKSSFTKAQISKKFDLDMAKLTERQATELLNIPRIYDCGKLKFQWCAEDHK